MLEDMRIIFRQTLTHTHNKHSGPWCGKGGLCCKRKPGAISCACDVMEASRRLETLGGSKIDSRKRKLKESMYYLLLSRVRRGFRDGNIDS